MPHWKTMTDHNYLHAGDLQGRDVTVKIARIQAGKLEGGGGRKANMKPICYFVGKDKPLALNATNCKTIAKLYGSPNTDDWVGKSITLYPTMTSMGSEEVECIRVRPKVPEARAPQRDDTPPPPTPTDGDAATEPAS